MCKKLDKGTLAHNIIYHNFYSWFLRISLETYITNSSSAIITFLIIDINIVLRHGL